MCNYVDHTLLVPLQHYDAFDREGWVVGEAVIANQCYRANKSAGHY